MGPYVDGYVLPIPKDKEKNYKKIASEAGSVWMKHGALAYYECVGEDLNPEMGGMTFTTFPQLLKTNADETVVFAFVVYRSRAHRDEVNAKVMAEMESQADKHKDESMPFDMARMAYGGFSSIVSYEKMD